MIAPLCKHEQRTKRGRDRKGSQRYKCKSCGKMFVDNQPRPLGDMRISMDKAETALKMLLEGMSVRATERITGIHRDTICDLVLHVGENCQRFMDSLEGIEVEDVQIDEIWSFVGAKEKNAKRSDHGDSWTFIAIERNTKMILAYEVGRRDTHTCDRFLAKLDQATRGSEFQITSDGLTMYRHGVPFALGTRVRFGQLIKTYKSSQTETRYSPATIQSIEKLATFNGPEEDRICTSHIERFNLTVRMQNRRFTRLTNAHSKSLDHHRAMQSILFVWYNWCRKHETIGMTPAKANGIADRKWTVAQLVARTA